MTSDAGIDLRSLDPDIRCYALIGRFFQEWAFLENEINSAIAIALDLDFAQRVMVTANMMVRDKIFLLRTAVDASFVLSDKQTHAKLLKDIAEYSGTRNFMAHTIFAPDPNSTGVKFLSFKAKGKLDLNADEIWSISDFNASYEKVNELMVGTERLCEAMKQAKVAKELFDKYSEEPSKDLLEKLMRHVGSMNNQNEWALKLPKAKEGKSTEKSK